MATITLSVPEETKRKMKQYDEMNWSAFIRKQIERKTGEIDELDSLRAQSRAEAELETFAVSAQRAGRSGRIEALRKKGLL